MRRFLLIAASALLTTACSPTSSDQAAPASIAAPAPDYTSEEKAALLATFPAPYNQADLDAGAKQFGKCRACHTVSADKMNLTGPHLYGLFGRKSGTEPGYTFTDAMVEHDVVWDFETLDDFLRAPQSVVKGTKMGYLGIKDDTDRHNLIAWLKVQTTPRETLISAQDESASASEIAP